MKREKRENDKSFRVKYKQDSGQSFNSGAKRAAAFSERKHCKMS